MKIVLKDLGLSKKWLWNKINNHVQIIWFCLPPFFYNFAQNSFFHWPKTSLLLTVDAWILFKWQTQCRATGKYVFSPLVSEYCLVFGSAHYTPAHNFQNWVQIQPRNKCEGAENTFFEDALLTLTILTVYKNTWGNVTSTELTKIFAL